MIEPPRRLTRQKSSFEEPYRIKRQLSHHFAVEHYQGSHEAALRNGFLCKVFGILLAQIAITGMISVYMLADGQARVDDARLENAHLEADLCEDNFCGRHSRYTNDGVCDDGGEGSEYFRCAFGTDCADCGIRRKGTVIRIDPSAGARNLRSQTRKHPTMSDGPS